MTKLNATQQIINRLMHFSVSSDSLSIQPFSKQRPYIKKQMTVDEVMRLALKLDNCEVVITMKPPRVTTWLESPLFLCALLKTFWACFTANKAQDQRLVFLDLNNLWLAMVRCTLFQCLYFSNTAVTLAKLCFLKSLNEW